jgi:hypothetical protein
MSNRKPIAPTIVLALLPILPALGAQVLAWTGTLPDGAEVQVDPETHKATRIEGGTAYPLWDGVHRMDDGAVVIVRDGIAVPNEEILQSWEGQPAEQETLVGRPCELLERRACGRDNACATTADCLKAKRLRSLERDEQRRDPLSAGPHPATAAGNRCGAALADPALIPCAGKPVDSGPGPCEILAERVCGPEGRCATAPACPPARQLRIQESREHAAAMDRGRSTPSGDQCMEALGNDFFAPCR